jgi:magnesium-transporting ATPase (P-type)
MYVKGAPDRLMHLCATQVAPAGPAGTGSDVHTVPLDPSFWQQAQAELSSKGLRVLALCRCGLGCCWGSQAGGAAGAAACCTL